LSWEDFRGKVLGATDPTTAESKAIRRQILDNWKSLGLTSKPNVADNGVHASASPFEAMAERINWVGAKLKTDAFAQAMMAAGISEKMILAWTKDPQVPYKGKKGSLFDLLEDMDSADCLAKAADIAGTPGSVPKYTKNEAYVFIKPHAVTPQVVDLVKKGLAKYGITILSEGTLDAKTIEDKLLIDNHYYAIANKASLTKPADLNPPEAKLKEFETHFGISWAQALKEGKVYNAVDACKAMGIDGAEMDRLWAKSKDANNLVKFGGGFYAGKVQQPIYVINGFYMAMREKYTKPPASIHYFVTEWDSSTLSWEDFRGKVLGATDPTTAESKAIRRQILDNWKSLGLTSKPNVADNGVHASASPFEAMAERINWVGAKLKTDAFAQAMMAAGISEKMILAWTKDPQVPYKGKKGSLFDLLEDMDSADCLAKAADIAGTPGSVPKYTKNEAYVFIKPHAVTPQVVDLVKKGLAKYGITILSEGTLDAKTIEDKLLIDNHYYAIANKASLTKPADLNPPEAKQNDFEKLFGISWLQALKEGKVYNAVDACQVMGIDGAEMDKLWAKSKDAGHLLKFGGGFYAGKVEP